MEPADSEIKILEVPDDHTPIKSSAPESSKDAHPPLPRTDGGLIWLNGMKIYTVGKPLLLLLLLQA
jgi:hypothetical protein